MNGKSVADKLNVDRAIMERDSKATAAKLSEAQFRLDEASRNLSDLEAIRNRLSGENGDLERKLDEADSQVAQLNKTKISLETQLADSQRMAEVEAKERLQLMSKYRSMESDRESMRQHLEEALEEKEDIMRQLSRANGETSIWRAKYACIIL
jgi:myosin heavy chain 6/7